MAWLFNHLLLHFQFLTLWLVLRKSPIPYNPLDSNDTDLTLSEFRLFPVRSSLLRKSLTIYFHHATKIFQFACFILLYRVVWYTNWVVPFRHLRLITVTGTLPKLFAANHVFHHLFYPRHPSIAFKKLTILRLYNIMLTNDLFFSTKCRHTNYWVYKVKRFFTLCLQNNTMA